MQLTVEYQSGVKQFNLDTPNRRHISKAAARGHKKGSQLLHILNYHCFYFIAVTDHCFKDETIREYSVNKVAQIIHSEVKKMCTHDVNSILRQTSCESLGNFQWCNLISELQQHAPTLMTILNACTKTRRYRKNKNGVIGMCAAMLLKFRYNRMSLVQKLISTILYAGHSGKQVNMLYALNNIS